MEPVEVRYVVRAVYYDQQTDLVRLDIMRMMEAKKSVVSPQAMIPAGMSEEEQLAQKMIGGVMKAFQVLQPTPGTILLTSEEYQKLGKPTVQDQLIIKLEMVEWEKEASDATPA